MLWTVEFVSTNISEVCLRLLILFSIFFFTLFLCSSTHCLVFQVVLMSPLELRAVSGGFGWSCAQIDLLSGQHHLHPISCLPGGRGSNIHVF